jgi:hypothetical protein
MGQQRIWKKVSVYVRSSDLARDLLLVGSVSELTSCWGKWNDESDQLGLLTFCQSSGGVAVATSWHPRDITSSRAELSVGWSKKMMIYA